MVKKQFEEIYALLEANQNRKVSTLMPELLELMKGKQANRTFMKDDDGNVTHIYCYYHKQWEAVDTELQDGIPYGKKASSSTGYNTMCKEGTSNWTKQNRTYKKTKELLLERVAAGEEVDINAELAAAAQAKDEIVPISDTYMLYVGEPV